MMLLKMNCDAIKNLLKRELSNLLNNESRVMNKLTCASFGE